VLAISGAGHFLTRTGNSALSAIVFKGERHVWSRRLLASKNEIVCWSITKLSDDCPRFSRATSVWHI